MEHYHLPLFILNTLLVLLDASLGYFMVPHLMIGEEDHESAEAVARTTRGMLPAIVALYMFFNCLGYFQGRGAYLLAVSGLLLLDLVLQLVLRHRRKKRGAGNGDPDE